MSDSDCKPQEEVFKKPVFIGPRKVKPPESSDQKNEKAAPHEADESSRATQPVEQSNVQETDKLISKSSVMAKIPYKEPSWGGMPPSIYSLEELKSGVIVRTIPLGSRSFHCFGRLEGCHISMLHPTISRYHAVLQFRSTFSESDESRGFYLFDLGSTHGTYLNKNRIKPEVYVRVQVGHMIKLGRSTRMFILQGPEDDQEDESELSITEMKEQKRLKKLEEERLKEEEERKQEEEGISWGMAEDADEETDLSENPYAMTTNEDLYIDDPKKTLRGWFEREGEELNYECEEKGIAHFICKVELPIDCTSRQSNVAEANVRGRKKDAVFQCALEACRILDRLGLLRQSTHESKQRKSKDWEADDFYDSDEDSFFDRTGELEVKRQQRMKQMGKVEETIDTYETLLVKHKNVLDQLEENERKLVKMTSITQHGDNAESQNSSVDSLDSFMSNLQDHNMDKLERKRCRVEIEKLKVEEKRLRRLVNFTKPPSLPELKPQNPTATSSKVSLEQNFMKVPEESNCEPKISVNSESKTSKEKIQVHPSKKEPLPPKIQKSKRNMDVHGTNEDSNSKVVENPTQREIRPKQSNKAQIKPKKVQENKFEEEYSTMVWQPPAGQTGDGRTSLNDKYGY